MDLLELATEDDRWAQIDLEAVAQTAIRATLLHLSVEPNLAELGVLACDDGRIAVLNGDFRAKPTPTNVLSWPAEERGAAAPGRIPEQPTPGPDGMIELGDIALSFDTCAAEAEAAGLSLAAHATHLLVHGTLHLLGYDHITDPDAALMERLEIEILGKLGLDNPYRET